MKIPRTPPCPTSPNAAPLCGHRQFRLCQSSLLAALCSLLSFIGVTCATGIAAEAPAPRPGADRAPIEDQIKKTLFENTTVKAAEIQDLGIATCLSARVYKIEITMGKNQQRGATNTIYAVTAKNLLEIDKPSTNADMPELLALVKPSFKLSDETAGLTMLSAFKAMYPPMGMNETTPRVIHKGKTWSFILGKFFENFSGFVVQTDATGKIVKIAYVLGIKEQ